MWDCALWLPHNLVRIPTVEPGVSPHGLSVQWSGPTLGLLNTNLTLNIDTSHLTPYTSHLTLSVLSLATDRALNGEYEFDLITNYESSNFVSQ